MTDKLWILGAVIVLAVSAQALLAVWSAITRLIHEKAQRQRATRLLQTRLEAAAAGSARKERQLAAWEGFRKFRVGRKEFEDADQQICSFYLRPHDSKPIPSFEPGQFLTFQFKIPDASAEAGGASPASLRRIVRCYSLSDYSSAPEEYRISVKRILGDDSKGSPPGQASCYLHDLVDEGMIVDVKAPKGVFFLDTSSESPVVLIGGGVGVTPVMCMLNAIAPSAVKRETWFFYGVRHGGEHIMRRHIGEVARAHPNVHVRICYSGPRAEDVKDRDYQWGERISVELLQRELPSTNYDFYIVGPPPMMSSLTAGLAEWGVPADRIHTEAFGPSAGPRRITAAPESVTAAGGIDVNFRKSDRKVVWGPEIGSLFDLAEANGDQIDSGCRQGNCGECQTAIRSGEVSYEKQPAFDYAEGTCLTCCSTPKGLLELDA